MPGREERRAKLPAEHADRADRILELAPRSRSRTDVPLDATEPTAYSGDHAKCGINTMFNTGTVVGAFANVFGAGYPRNFIPDFAWGGPDSDYRTYKLEEAYTTATTVMARRQAVFSELDKAVLRQVHQLTAKYRSWEKGT